MTLKKPLRFSCSFLFYFTRCTTNLYVCELTLQEYLLCCTKPSPSSKGRGERGEEKNQDTLSTYTSEKLVWKGRPLNGGKVRSALNAQKVHTELAAQSKEKKLASGVGVK